MKERDSYYSTGVHTSCLGWFSLVLWKTGYRAYIYVSMYDIDLFSSRCVDASFVLVLSFVDILFLFIFSFSFDLLIVVTSRLCLK